MFITVPFEDMSVDGFINLSFEDKEGLVIVDYKTDAVDTKESSVFQQRKYDLLGGAYAWMATGNWTTGA